MELEPMPVDRLSFGMLEPMDPELLYLLVSNKDDSSSAATATIKCGDVKEEVLADDDMMPLNLVVSTPTGVEAYNPDFSNVEMQDLMTLLLPERATISTDMGVAPIRTTRALQPKKLGKRTKKCTYAARRREVASLRSEVANLEATLNNLRCANSGDSDWLQRAADEKAALDKAQTENARLREVVSAREAKIRKLDAYLCTLQR
jgi:hypothetical protein